MLVAALPAGGAGARHLWHDAESGGRVERAAPTLEGRALVDALRRGGYVLYLRHTSTDFSQNDAAMTSYADCASQRNLTDAGRAEARAIAAGLRALRIPIGEVLASPYCRTMESGRLAFGKATPSPAVRGGPAQAESAERYAELRRSCPRPSPAGRTSRSPATAIRSTRWPGRPISPKARLRSCNRSGNGRSASSRA